MDTYSTLIEQILANPLLKEQVHNLAVDYESLNLVTKNWKETLENHQPFQDFQQNAHEKFQPERSTLNNLFKVQTLKDDVTPLRVIVAGYCNMYKPYDKRAMKQPLAITMRESPAMDMLIKAFTSDVDSKIQVAETCKVNFRSCSICCQHCSNARECMVSKGIQVNFDCPQPCIADISVFNGKKLVNRFGSQVSACFPGTFIVIAKIELNVRYFYNVKDSKTKMVRVGGSVFEMVCFPESNLKETKVDLGDLNAIVETGFMLDQEESVSERKRSLEEFDIDEDDNDESIIDAIPAEKKQKSWEDDYEVLEDTIKF